MKDKSVITAFVCRVVEHLADGTAALVEWKLLTGRTHQIRVHAKHLGCPLFGDAAYGGVGTALSLLAQNSKKRCDDPWNLACCRAMHATMVCSQRQDDRLAFFSSE